MIWKNLRVDIDTMRRLEVYRIALEAAIRRNPDGYPEDYQTARLSLGQCVSWMLGQRDRHKARRGKARKKSAGKPDASAGTV